MSTLSGDDLQGRVNHGKARRPSTATKSSGGTITEARRGPTIDQRAGRVLDAYQTVDGWDGLRLLSDEGMLELKRIRETQEGLVRR